MQFKQILLNIGMVVMGLALGLGLLEAVLARMRPSREGMEFQSINDVRSAILGSAILGTPILQSGQARGSADDDEIERDEDLARGNLRAIVNPHLNDRIIYDLRPNLETTFQRVPLKTNSCGMRDVERAHLKPANTYRIALLGDSFAFGWGVEADKIFARRLEDNLNRLAEELPDGAAARRFEVLNFAVPGYSTFQEVELFFDKGVDFNPDAILVYFVQNDFGMPFYVRDIYRPGGILAATEFARLAWKAIDPKVEEQRLELLGYDPSSALRLLSDYTRANAIRLSVVFNPRKTWRSDMQRIKVLHERPDIEVIALRPDFLRLMNQRGIEEKELTLEHDPHPSALRHAMLGDLLTGYYLNVGF